MGGHDKPTAMKKLSDKKSPSPNEPFAVLISFQQLMDVKLVRDFHGRCLPKDIVNLPHDRAVQRLDG